MKPGKTLQQGPVVRRRPLGEAVALAIAMSVTTVAPLRLAHAVTVVPEVNHGSLYFVEGSYTIGAGSAPGLVSDGWMGIGYGSLYAAPRPMASIDPDPGTHPGGGYDVSPSGSNAHVSGGTAQVTNHGSLINYNGSIRVSTAGTLSNQGSLENYVGSIRNRGTLTNDGTLLNEYYGSIANHGTLTNTGSGTLDNYQGSVTNYASGVLNNDGQFHNRDFLSNSGTLANGGSLYNSGTAINAGTLSNSGTFQNRNRLVNSGTLDNSGLLINDNAQLSNTGTLANSGTLRNLSGALDTGGQVVNEGTLENSGAVNVIAGGSLRNSGGTLANDGTLRNEGDLLNFDGSTLDNSGTLVNDGWFENHAGWGGTHGSTVINRTGAVIENQAGRTFHNGPDSSVLDEGEIRNRGTVWNEGRFEIASSGSVTGDGLFRQDHAGAVTVVDGLLQADTIDIRAGTLTGTGTLDGNAVFGDGAVVSAGHSPGTLTFQGDVDFSGDLVVEVFGPSAGEYDLYDASGYTFGFDSALAEVLFDFSGWTLGAGNYDITFLLAEEITGFAGTPVSYTDLPSWADASVVWHHDTGGPDSLVLSLEYQGTPPPSVPEPAPLGLMLAASGLFWLRSRDRRGKTA